MSGKNPAASTRTRTSPAHDVPIRTDHGHGSHRLVARLTCRIYQNGLIHRIARRVVLSDIDSLAVGISCAFPCNNNVACSIFGNGRLCGIPGIVRHPTGNTVRRTVISVVLHPNTFKPVDLRPISDGQFSIVMNYHNRKAFCASQNVDGVNINETAIRGAIGVKFLKVRLPVTLPRDHKFSVTIDIDGCVTTIGTAVNQN